HLLSFGFSRLFLDTLDVVLLRVLRGLLRVDVRRPENPLPLSIGKLHHRSVDPLPSRIASHRHVLLLSGATLACSKDSTTQRGTRKTRPQRRARSSPRSIIPYTVFGLRSQRVATSSTRIIVPG